MKQPKASRSHTRPKGLTLIELTVVILVLLALITVLFIGGRAWKKGSDRAGCILNIRNAQQAVRSYQNLRGLPDGAPLNFSADIVGC
ncbi:MAG: type II secretion system protein [Akkermansiaceae bacterium]|nr:type II secretion system protein [Akkermansiaceae bacterium]